MANKKPANKIKRPSVVKRGRPPKEQPQDSGPLPEVPTISLDPQLEGQKFLIEIALQNLALNERQVVAVEKIASSVSPQPNAEFESLKENYAKLYRAYMSLTGNG